MDKQKRVEEMAKVIEQAMAKARRTIGGHNNIATFYATMLSNAGYRKIPESAVVLTGEEYEELKKGVHTVSYQAMINESDQQHWLDGYKVGYRDGVVAVQKKAKEKIDEICNKLTGGK